jgi:hypothetical protein
MKESGEGATLGIEHLSDSGNLDLGALGLPGNGATLSSHTLVSKPPLNSFWHQDFPFLDGIG